MGTWEHKRGARRNVSDVMEGSAISWTSLVIVAIVSNLAKQEILPTNQDMPTLVMANHVNHFFSAFQISKEWTFGSELCEMWTMSDVLCCTASILHLLAIAVDRLERKQQAMDRI